jgi:hypothetical protein
MPSPQNAGSPVVSITVVSWVSSVSSVVGTSVGETSVVEVPIVPAIDPRVVVSSEVVVGVVPGPVVEVAISVVPPEDASVPVDTPESPHALAHASAVTTTAKDPALRIAIPNPPKSANVSVFRGRVGAAARWRARVLQRGSIQTGLVQARSWMVWGRVASLHSSGRSASARVRQSRQLHRQVGVSRTRA